MKDIKTIYSYYNFNFPNEDKKIKLIYKISQYQLLKKQCKHYRKNLVKQGEKIKLLSSHDGEKRYYKLYCEKEINLKQRKKIVDVVLGIKNNNDKTLENQIIEKHETINYCRVTKDDLTTRESTALDVLASFLLIGNDFSDVLDYGTLKKHQSKESELKDDMSVNNKRSSKAVTKTQIKKWHKSKTYRFNNIFSFDNKYHCNFEGKIYNNNYYKKPQKDHFIRNGIINSYEPYEAIWVNIDNNNEFIYNSEIYLIDNHQSYKPQKRYKRYDDYKDMYKMDKVLVIEQYSNLYFFDMDIYQIDNKYIKKM
jgi:hypothetical protein